MNWYIKTIFSQVDTQFKLESYLKTLGATPDIIQYIITQDINASQYLTNEFRKNPGLNIQQLQQLPLSQKINPYLRSEYNIASSYPEIRLWILINLKKIRKGKRSTDNYSLEDLSMILTEEENAFYFGFQDKLDEIYDWVTRSEPRPEIASYSPQQAIEESNEWHRMIAGKGEGKNYEPTKKELIVYGPKWKSEELEGWTIQKIMSKNDLLAEGNKMDHCVGSYCDQMLSGNSLFYSLRDHQNKPYVTIETDTTGEYVQQIQGHFNDAPEDIHKNMIREWILSTKGAPNYYLNKNSDWEMDGNLDEMEWKLNDIKNGYIEDDYSSNIYAEDYGLETESNEFQKWTNNFDVEELMNLIFRQIEYEYGKIDWEIDGNYSFVDTLISTLRFLGKEQDGKNYYIKTLEEILKEQLKSYPNLPPGIVSDDEDDRYTQKSFSKFVLNALKEPESQLSFDFSKKSNNWYKKILTSDNLNDNMPNIEKDSF